MGLLDALNDAPVGEVHVLGVVLETQRRRRLAQQLRRADNDLSKKKIQGWVPGLCQFLQPSRPLLSFSLSLSPFPFNNFILFFSLIVLTTPKSVWGPKINNFQSFQK